MSEIGDYFKDWKEHYRDIRENAKDKRLKFLKGSDIDYEILNLSAGHVRIYHDATGAYDAWLGTGKWTKVGSGTYHQSWTNLLKVLDL